MNPRTDTIVKQYKEKANERRKREEEQVNTAGNSVGRVEYPQFVKNVKMNWVFVFINELATKRSIQRLCSRN